jgi:RNA polymerase sigma factor (sigma-70 family)
MQRADVEDLISDINVKLLGVVQEKRPYHGYTRTVISNAVRTSLNKVMAKGAACAVKWREYSTEDYHVAAPSYSEEEVDADALDRLGASPSPEDRLLTRATLDHAISTLPAKHQEAVRLYYFNEWTMSRVAEEMGCSHTYVDVLLNSGVRKLRARLGVRLHRVRFSCTRPEQLSLYIHLLNCPLLRTTISGTPW